MGTGLPGRINKPDGHMGVVSKLQAARPPANSRYQINLRGKELDTKREIFVLPEMRDNISMDTRT